ncbi:MAG: T9SS type A sorting domain-containing protein [Sphingobacteriales bacterium]|nr:MAG: T9SS type A sorting domain-containing protein [Sphingobacteriales bacterium]
MLFYRLASRSFGYGALANASFWQHFPLKKEYKQPWVTKEQLTRKGYLNTDGKIDYTETVRFVNSGSKATFNIYPNPVADHQANISLNGYAPGNYTFRLISATGQVVLEKSIQYNGGISKQTLQLPGHIVAGKYSAQISGKSGIQNFPVVVL